ncbi:MAG: transcription antitermination factor NusB [Thermoleophilaceae bacterium]|nr:transcription antitermination factor NusB [Thermoleophilaceae bacterium]
MRRTEQRRAAVVALYQADLNYRTARDVLEPTARTFTRELVQGVEHWREEIDGLIERHAVGWTLDRIAPVERNILRVALFEVLHRPDVPAEVAIDEAIEAAQELCGADAPGFVNGILGAVHRESVGSA